MPTNSTNVGPLRGWEYLSNLQMLSLSEAGNVYPTSANVSTNVEPLRGWEYLSTYKC